MKAAAKDGELCHFNAEWAFLEAGVDEKIYIKIPEEYQEFPGTMRLLNKMVCRLEHAGRCWNSKFCEGITAFRFNQLKADPYVSHKADNGELDIVVVGHVDDILAHAKDEEITERCVTELGRKIKLKDMGDASFFGGANPLKRG